MSTQILEPSQIDNIEESSMSSEIKDELNANNNKKESLKEEYYSRRHIPLQLLSQLDKDGNGEL